MERSIASKSIESGGLILDALFAPTLGRYGVAETNGKRRIADLDYPSNPKRSLREIPAYQPEARPNTVWRGSARARDVRHAQPNEQAKNRRPAAQRAAG
jgi:hypothetical protein